MAYLVRTKGGNIPTNAIRAGYERCGRPLYVAKAKHNGGWIPGKAGSHLPGCHLPYGGEECIVEDYDVLVYDKKARGFLEWREASDGYVPDPHSAFCFNRGDAVYVARAYCFGSLIPGKLHTSHRCAYVTYNDMEISVQEYEGMAYWVRTKGGNIPTNAIRAGYERCGRPLYVAKAKHNGGWIPGKAGSHLPGCHLPYGGEECIVEDYDVLVYDKKARGFLEWREASDGYVPDPHSAFCFNRGDAVYVARAYCCGSLIPGKLHTSHGCAYVAYNDVEIPVQEYEVLCRVK